MCNHPQHKHHPEAERGLVRRDVLKYGMAGLGITAFGPWGKSGFAAPAIGTGPANVRRLIILNCGGGNDVLNTIIPIANSVYYSIRPNLSFQPAETTPLVGTTAYAGHAYMPRLTSLYNQGNVAIILKTGNSNNPSGSHFTEIARMASGFTLAEDNGDSQAGWITRLATLNLQNPWDVFHLGEDSRADFRPDPISGGVRHIGIPGVLSSFKFKSQNMAVQDHLIRRNHAAAMVAANNSTRPLDAHAKVIIEQSIQLEQSIRNAVDNYVPAPGLSGANVQPGFACADMAALIQAGFGTRIFYSGVDGFDTHSDQEPLKHVNCLLRTDRFVGDMALELQHAGGNAWNDTVILVTSEFGRRNAENGSGGTDHGEATMSFVIGGAVNGGIYGNDIVDADLLTPSLPVEIDWRDILREILMNHMNMDPTPIFTEAQNINTGPLGFI